MAAGFYFLISCSAFLCFFSGTSIAADFITRSKSISDGQSLVSQNGIFVLGFFSPGKSNRYVGIWYKNIPTQTVVWVANRDNPLTDSTGVLKIDDEGNIVLVNKTNSLFWSSNSSKAVAKTESLILRLLGSGNLVLSDGKGGNPDQNFLWQSFDYPCDTLLPGMKMGWDLKTGLNRRLSAWKSEDDPSPGEITHGMELYADPEAVMWIRSRKRYRSGPWNGRGFSGASHSMKDNAMFTYHFTFNEEEVSFLYQPINGSILSRTVLEMSHDSGQFERLYWDDRQQKWEFYFKLPKEFCDEYGACGAYSNCDMNASPYCKCLKGFKPKSPAAWNSMIWSDGCTHQTSLDCGKGKGEGFLIVKSVKLPDAEHTWLNKSMNLEECKAECLRNCSCTAYANFDVTERGSGCVLWFGDLIDIKQFPSNGGGQELYIRVAASDLDASRTEKRLKLVVAITVTLAVLLLGCCGFCIIWRKKKTKSKELGNIAESVTDRSLLDESHMDNLELPSFDFVTIATATHNFSDKSKLGEGGFGPVYMGKFPDGQQIAVKRLSKTSLQGPEEFKNEVILISKLQHRNLVRLLGCCIHAEERMLIYEYMDNQSLDHFIFDQARSKLLNWKLRLRIILGIARGLLYLHQDSRLRIIHRDLKTSNILLDGKMEPKISDFGMARIFGGDQIEAETNRVVGTFGYMPPEYAIDGIFSVKSDVYSFGVIVLEIISGKRNRGFCHPEFQLNLLGHTWSLWNEGRAMELIDPSMRDSCCGDEVEVLRCIHVGLLCVQQNTEDRPTMASVVLMLSSECALAKPQQPGFFAQRYPVMTDSSSSKQESSIANDLSATVLEGR